MDDEKLLKVLALAASKHDGEALSAIRAAQIILARQGMTLQDLARTAPDRTSVERPPAPAPEPDPYRSTVADPDRVITILRRKADELRQSVDDLTRRLQQQTTESDRHRHEADHWRALARETADRLWDLGKALEAQSRDGTRSSGATPPRRQDPVELLRDPHMGILSDREIARLCGVPATLVRRLRALQHSPRRRSVSAGSRGRDGKGSLRATKPCSGPGPNARPPGRRLKRGGHGISR